MAESKKWSNPAILFTEELSADDYFLIVQDSSGQNRKIKKSVIADKLGVGYKKYVALLTQSGENPPVPTVLENTLGGTLVWTRDSEGFYNGTLSGAFPVELKVWFIMGNTTSDAQMSSYWLNENAVQIGTNSQPNGPYADTKLFNTPIAIRVYP